LEVKDYLYVDWKLKTTSMLIGS